ncbi:hypothetical protein NDU88_004863 [Pleurodeles waltl]|uniref:Uncharacterized protein n=1 Tax=Pleurodeles waltl TaxID=8319 RepID=A0AAV7PDQ8_PLEWA|nr:hypothetical protein NDU88_004863 [Pleurodeles waltl]
MAHSGCGHWAAPAYALMDDKHLLLIGAQSLQMVYCRTALSTAVERDAVQRPNASSAWQRRCRLALKSGLPCSHGIWGCGTGALKQTVEMLSAVLKRDLPRRDGP